MQKSNNNIKIQEKFKKLSVALKKNLLRRKKSPNLKN